MGSLHPQLTPTILDLIANKWEKETANRYAAINSDSWRVPVVNIASGPYHMLPRL